MKSSHLFLTSLLALNMAWSEGFEAPQFQVEEGINGKSEWVSDGAVVTGEKAKEGSQSLKIASGQTVSRLAGGPGIVFYDLAVWPTFVEGATTPSVFLGGAELGFSKNGEVGSLLVFSKGEGELAVTEMTGFPVAAESNLSNAWVRLTVRMDVAKGTWDLYVDGRPTLADVAVAQAATVFEVKGQGEIYLDSWQQAEDNPLFPDADKDGLPDAEESALGLNPYGDDRNGDLDGDGISNAQEFFDGTSPRVAGASGLSGPIVYVDNLRGNDANSGQRSYGTSAGDGPKASLKAAMAAAPDQAIIAVLPGTGIYNEGSRGAEDKQLTIKTVGPVTIK